MPVSAVVTSGALIVAVPASVGAAASFAVANVAQMRGARRSQTTRTLDPGLLLHLGADPLWLAGLGASIIGFALEATALAIAPVVLVQPLIVAELLFALPLPQQQAAVASAGVSHRRRADSPGEGASLRQPTRSDFRSAGRPSPIVDRDESAVIPIELDVNDESVDRQTVHESSDPGSARCGGERCGLRHGGAANDDGTRTRAGQSLRRALDFPSSARVYAREHRSRIIRVFGLESLENYIADAKAICYACQARKECLEFALATRHGFGIWGGRDEDERRRLRRSRQAQQRLRQRKFGDFVAPDDPVSPSRAATAATREAEANQDLQHGPADYQSRPAI